MALSQITLVVFCLVILILIRTILSDVLLEFFLNGYEY
jgi:hypothetical protein